MSVSPWRPTPAHEVRPGDRVSLTGIGYKQSAIIDVGEIDETRTGGVLTFTGWQSWGMGRRFIARSVHRWKMVDRYVPPEPAS